MKKHITTKFNYVYENYGEINTMPSATIPEDSMSLRDMLDRYARGIPLPESRLQPYYNDKEVLPNINNMDLADLQTLRENATLQTQQLENELKEEIATRKKAPAPKSSETVPPVPSPEPPAPPSPPEP